MHYMNHRNNTGLRSDPTTMTAQGDFAVKSKVISTRPDHIETEVLAEGSLTEGVSLQVGLYSMDEDQPMFPTEQAYGF